MRSLFLKIFLWFWVTQVLVTLGMVAVFAFQPEFVVSRWRTSTGDALALYAQTGAEIADREGVAGLKGFLARLDHSAHIQASVFDDQGQLMAGKPSAAATNMARQARSSGEPQFRFAPTATITAQPARGPSGREYVFAADLPRNGAFGFFRHALPVQLMRWTVGIFIAGVICYFIAIYLTRPILRLRSATRQLATGDFTARAGPGLEKRRDELGDLVRDFNQMAEQLENQVNSGRQLIRDISHELRSPLARLNVALGLARQRSTLEAAASFDRMERETERLNEMIGRLLTLARLGAASEPAQRSHIDLPELVEEIAADAKYEAQAKQCDVRLVAGDPCSINGNPELVRSAVENVVRNAVRYTHAGSEVEIALRCPEDGAIPIAKISVRDHGPGLPPEELENIFRPFYRVAEARDRDSGGVGLGLAITERAVRLHGGTVVAKNASDGGLMVEISLPVTAGNGKPPVA